MAKLLKISGRTLGILLEWIVLFLVIFAFAIRTSPVQTFLAHEATAYLSSELNTTVKVDEVDIVFVDKVALDGFLLLDQDKDTLLYAETLYASLDEMDLSKNYFRVGKVELHNAVGHIKKDKNGIQNTQFLKDYFSPGKQKKKTGIELDINTAVLNNIDFRYDDNRKPHIQTKGMDYAHIHAKDIYGTFDNIEIINDTIYSTITELKAKEKCGFVLKQMYADAKVSPLGVYMENLAIRSEHSVIDAPKFNLISSDYQDFNQFEDSVAFDARLAKSVVSMKDVALFAPQLDGMDETVRVSANVSRKVGNLKISNLDLRIRRKTYVRGNINLPDFKDIESAFFQERLDKAYIDIAEIKKIRLPNSSPKKYITMNPRVERLGYFNARNVRLDGFYSQFVVASERVHTRLGTVRMNNGVLFTQNKKNDSYFFSRSGAGDYDVKIEEFQLGTFLGRNDLGVIDGIFFLSGEAFSPSLIKFTDIDGDVNRLDYRGYAYNNITIYDGTFHNNVLEGKIDVKDDNLDLTYNGKIDLNGEQSMEFTIDLADAVLSKLGFRPRPNQSSLSSVFTVNMTGTTPNTLDGTVKLDGFVYTEKGKEIKIPSMTLKMKRGEFTDLFTIESEIAHGEISGKIDFEHLYDDINYQLSRIFPALFDEKVKQNRTHIQDHFTFDLTIKEANSFLAIFEPRLKISKGAKLKGKYFGESSQFSMDVTSEEVFFEGMRFSNLNFHQVLDSNSLVSTYHVDQFAYNKSIAFNDLYFKSTGGNNQLASEFTWDQNTPNASAIRWETNVYDIDHFKFILEPSYFSIQEHKWEIAHESTVQIDSDTVHLSEFKLQRGEQFLLAEGTISGLDKHRLNFEVNDLELSELAGFFIEDKKITGKANAWGFISNPYKNLQYIGDAHILKMHINDESLGDIFVQSQWNKKTRSIDMSGDLMYKNVQTFDFNGHYYLFREKENLDFSLLFDHTNIQFTNAFMDPDVLTDIRGLLNGTLSVTGTPDEPIMRGSVQLNSGSAYVKLLGAHFGFDGPIEVDKYGFYIDGMPVFDEEGNAGSLIGSVYHDNFADFNFDLQFDLEDDAINRDPLEPWKVIPLERFLVMNSQYEPGSPYYGKAYATGTANIFGYTDNLEITVDMKSQRGTLINFPMYGVGEIDSESSFITFKPKGDQDTTDTEPKIDFTGVHLDLTLDVTHDANMRIIFNEELGDVITANGAGRMAITVDQLNQITLAGTYTVANGLYDFVMGPIKQKFYIQPGGAISWTGDPYNALLNLQTYHVVNANIAELSPDQFSGGTKAHEEVLCYLNLGETLLKPSIGFDIKAPKANETGKSLINRITSDADELNRQFFSLMLWKRFQPLAGQGSGGGGAALDLIANEINTQLAKISKDYKLNVNLDNDELTGDNTFEFGVKKGFLDDRLIISGSFGVENQHTADHDESSLIGDVNLEYYLNESRTFKVNIFNESNDKTIIQDEQRGDFTQGIGIYYQEDFNTMEDFKAVQYFLDIFRKKQNKRYPIKKKRRQVPVPKDEDPITLPTEGDNEENTP